MKFSERIGIIKAKDTIQVDFMDDDLRNSLWNAVCVFYLDKVGSSYINSSSYKTFFSALWHHFFKLPIDSLENWYGTTRLQIRDWFYSWDWYEVYDFIEFITKLESPSNKENFIEFCNGVLERELSGYRFINGTLSPITSKEEINEIDEAINMSAVHSLVGAKTHLEEALKKLSDRKSPDYRNSIKESISSVESISKAITQNHKATLGDALKALKEAIALHPALEKGFKQIYGYTSDSDGIRHSLMDESNCDFEDAKYMLVSCSAFVNYLIIKAEKAGIEIKN